ncbi:MAG: DUF1353 domain-containing protein [Rhodospirillales bacterium]|nr:DUF1353 domain-containing protein [Rhodospirillales bacterium]
MAKITNYEFLTDLHLVRFLDGHPPISSNYDGLGVRKLFFLSKPYKASFCIDGKHHIYKVPAPMSTDLASIPKWVPKWIAQKVGPHIEAAIVHDHMCQNEAFDYKIAAEIFYAGMIAGGTPKWRAQAMYRAVLYGGPKW